MMIRIPHAHQMHGHTSPLLKSYHQRSASSRKLSRQFGKDKSLRRFLVAVFLLVVLLSALRHYLSRSSDGVVLRSQDVVLGNCASIEVSRGLLPLFKSVANLLALLGTQTCRRMLRGLRLCEVKEATSKATYAKTVNTLGTRRKHTLDFLLRLGLGLRRCL